MAEITFSKQGDITDEWLSYIEGKAIALSNSNNNVIQESMDVELLNPEIQRFLEADTTEQALADVEEEREPMALSQMVEARAAAIQIRLMPRFKKLKKKIKKIFCKVARGMEGVDTKQIIEAVLVALIAAFSAGVGAALLPLIVGIVALFIKEGIDKVCPV